MRRVHPLLRSPAVLLAKKKNPERLDDVTKGNGAAAPTKILYPLSKHVEDPTKLNTLGRKRSPSVFRGWTNALFFWRAMDFSGKINRAGLLRWSPGWQIKVWKWAKHTSFLLELHFSLWKKKNLLYLWSSCRTICTLLRTDNMCNCFTQTDRFTQESHPGDPEDALFRSQEKFSGEHIPVFFCFFSVKSHQFLHWCSLRYFIRAACTAAARLSNQVNERIPSSAARCWKTIITTLYNSDFFKPSFHARWKKARWQRLKDNLFTLITIIKSVPKWFYPRLY